MDYKELIDALADENNPNVLDYIDDAVQMLEQLKMELNATKTRCEILSKMVTKYQDNTIPEYRARLEKAESERDAAVRDLNEILSLDEMCPLQCEWCAWDDDCDGTKPPKWRGVKGD